MSSNKPATTTTTQTQTKNPWAPADASMRDVVSRSTALGQDLSNFMPTYSGATQQGIQMLQDAASNGSGAFTALNQVVPGSTAGFGTGLGQLQSVAGGDYLNSNQYLKPVLDQMTKDVADKTNAQFTAAGRYGSGAHAQTLARNIGQVENQALLGNYQQERGNQDAAAKTLMAGGFQGAGMGGQLDQSAVTPAMLNLQAGNLLDQQATAQRQAPLTAAQWQSQMVSPIAQSYGSTNTTGTSQTVQPTNPLTQALGYGSLGLGLLGSPTQGTGLTGLYNWWKTPAGA